MARPNAMARPLAMVTALVAVVALIWLGWEYVSPPDPTPTVDDTVAKADRGSASMDLEPRDTQPSNSEREVVEPRAGASTGSMLLTMTWASDKSPAAGIPVTVLRRGVDRLLDSRRGETDADGEVLFEGLAPGKVLPYYRRGNERRVAEVEIVAGERATVAFEMPLGMTARGWVVDGDNAPIAGADILVSNSISGQPLGKSAADGTFLLHHLPTFCHIGARKPGYAPTRMRFIQVSEGAEIEITIVMSQGGGTLLGVVFDPKGQPVVDAVVRAGDPEQHGEFMPDGGSSMAPRPQLTRTDEAGRFAFDCVATGEVPIAVRSREFAPFFDRIKITPGQRRELTVHLVAGVALFGTVRDGDGVPLADIEVDAGDYKTLARRSTRTAVDGTYRLAPLAAGELQVQAGDLDPCIVRETLQVAPGEQVRWDPVLEAGPSLHGRILTQDGKPLVNAQVVGHLEPWREGDSWFGIGRSDTEGRFTLTDLPADRMLRIEVGHEFPMPVAVLHAVTPGPDELLIQIGPTPTALIRGRVLGPDGEVIPLARITGGTADLTRGAFRASVDPDTGVFEAGPLPASRYSMKIRAPDYPSLQFERELAHGETWDLGTVRFEPGGSLSVELIGDIALIDSVKYLPIYCDGRYLARHEFSADGNFSPPLAAGDYELMVKGGSLAAQKVSFSIRSGAKTRIDVPVTAGVEATIFCEMSEPPIGNRATSTEMRDAAGQTIYRGHANLRQGRYRDILRLLPGSYTVLVARGDLSGTATLTVGDQPCSVTVQLTPN